MGLSLLYFKYLKKTRSRRWKFQWSFQTLLFPWVLEKCSEGEILSYIFNHMSPRDKLCSPLSPWLCMQWNLVVKTEETNPFSSIWRLALRWVCPSTPSQTFTELNDEPKVKTWSLLRSFLTMHLTLDMYINMSVFDCPYFSKNFFPWFSSQALDGLFYFSIIIICIRLLQVIHLTIFLCSIPHSSRLDELSIRQNRNKNLVAVSPSGSSQTD